MSHDAALDAQTRRVDEDRWLASRFAPKQLRARLAALYALNHEIARTAESVTQGGLGDIRLAWWRDAIAEIYDGRPPRAHPALAAFADLVRETTLQCQPLEEIIHARAKDLDPAPFADWAELDAYLDATAGGIMGLALAACDVAPADAFIREAGRAWGYAGLLRVRAFWQARGRDVFPPGVTTEAMRERAVHAHAQARALFKALPSEAFPASGYVAFVPMYVRTREPTLLARQARLLWASASGRL